MNLKQKPETVDTVHTHTHTHTHTGIFIEDNAKTKLREIWIDYTKAFACILVVIGHMLQGLNKANIKWNENLYYYINNFIYIFHMPLFMCLSGYLYAKYTQITNKKDYFKFVMKKIINLGIPYIFFYVAYVLINMMFSSSVNSSRGFQDILNIFTNPISPFWFLYALTVIFILIPIIEKILKNKYEIIFCILTFFFVLSLYFKTQIYAIDIFAQYAVYFYFGVILVKKMQIKNRKIFSNTFVNSVIFIFLAIMCCSIEKYNILNSSIISLFKLTLAFYAIIIIINIFKNVEKNKYFDIISKYTFPIYLMHTIFSAGIRIVLLKIGINNFYIHFILGLLFGIIIPIVISYILKITKYGNILLYPLNTMKEIKESKNENSNDRS